METFFRTSFADVRVYVGAEASTIGALAFAHGSNLYFAPGQYNPGTPHGQRLLGHELAHVVQQRSERVRNPLGAGVVVVQDPVLEFEAERMGRQAASACGSIQPKPAGTAPHSNLCAANRRTPVNATVHGAILPALSAIQQKARPGILRKSPFPGTRIALGMFSRRVVQRVLNVGDDYLGSEADVDSKAVKHLPKKAGEEERRRILDNLKAMAGSKTSEYEFANWPQAIAAARGEKLPEPAGTLGKDKHNQDLTFINIELEEEEEEEVSSNTDWGKLFREVVDEYEPKFNQILKPQFKEAETKSTTGANDAHQSIAQALVYSARGLAMDEALKELQRRGCPKGVLKKLRRKKVNTEKKAKTTGETHHMK
jgi:Domain of unknown function (DUF4157)